MTGIDPRTIVITEPVKDSPIPVDLMLIETIDGVYAPIGLRKPPGPGPFPLVLFASGNGGGGSPPRARPKKSARASPQMSPERGSRR